MSTHASPRVAADDRDARGVTPRGRTRRLSALVDSADAGGYGARQVWLYATILTVGYMVSRGLAKSGSRDPYDADDGNR
jgi:hypothetical protein